MKIEQKILNLIKHGIKDLEIMRVLKTSMTLVRKLRKAFEEGKTNGQSN